MTNNKTYGVHFRFDSDGGVEYQLFFLNGTHVNAYMAPVFGSWREVTPEQMKDALVVDVNKRVTNKTLILDKGFAKVSVEFYFHAPDGSVHLI